jgi:predicted methyltransferase
VASHPEETWLAFLLAWSWRVAQDPARESSVVAAMPEDRRPVYARLFGRDPEAVTALLRYRAWDACRFDPANTCPPAPTRPPDWPVFEQVAWSSHNANRVEHWRPGGEGMDAFLRAVGAAPGLRIADVGAGEGYFTIPLARAVGPNGRVVATEIDPVYTTFIEGVARDLGLNNVQTVVQPHDDVALDGGTFDVVLMCEVFKAIATNGSASDPEHVRTRVAPFLASIARALAPGGRLVAVDHDAPTSVPKAISPATVRRLAEDAGFRLVSRDDRWAPTEVIQVFEPIRR